MFGKIIRVEKRLNLICRGIEVVITGLTRNQFVSNHTRVRIPPSAPNKNGNFDTKLPFIFMPKMPIYKGFPKLEKFYCDFLSEYLQYVFGFLFHKIHSEPYL